MSWNGWNTCCYCGQVYFCWGYLAHHCFEDKIDEKKKELKNFSERLTRLEEKIKEIKAERG